MKSWTAMSVGRERQKKKKKGALHYCYALNIRLGFNNSTLDQFR